MGTPMLSGGSTGSTLDRIVQISPDSGARSIDGKRVVENNNLPTNLQKGTSSASLHAGMFGDFKDVRMAYFSGVEFIRDIYTDALNQKERLISRLAYDFYLQRTGNMVITKEIKIG